MYRIPDDTEFAFAYHPWRSTVAPEIGYIIKTNETLRKIFHIGKAKINKDMPTIILHIVFKDQYHLYETENPFGQKKKETSKNKNSNSDLMNLNDDLNTMNTFYHENRGLRINTSPSALNLLNRAETDTGIYQNTVTNFNQSPEHNQKGPTIVCVKL